MHKTLYTWLNELIQEAKIITSLEIDEEAHENMVSFGVNAELLGECGKESVSELLKRCAIIFRQKRAESPMVFYSWFDEQAGQIRMSAVSQAHGKLPFKCKLNQTSLDALVNGVYAKDSGLFSKGALDVWQQDI
jgi:hypothetical protein